jgi:cell division protein FtsA
MNNFYAAIELGTTRTVLAIGEAETGGWLRVTCHAEIPSAGIRKSQILNIPDTTQSIRSVLREIERKQEASGASITIGNAFLVVSGQHVRADPFSGTVQVEGARVTSEDMEAAFRAARAMNVPREREMLDIVDQDYVLDERGGIPSPKGLSGRVLRLNTLHIHADSNRIQDARTAADAAHLELRDPLFATTCAAEAVLEDHEKRHGVLLLDMGGGSTGYAVYTDGYLAAAEVIGVGGDHVTNDIAHAFQTTNTQAEGLKIREASATVGMDEGLSARVKVDPGENTLLENRTISRRALNIVVNARLLELLTVLRERLAEQDLLHRIHAGVVLTGGAARMKNLEGLVSQTLGASVRFGKPIHVDGFEDDPNAPSYAAVAGALLYAHRNYEDKSLIGDIIDRIFRK